MPVSRSKRLGNIGLVALAAHPEGMSTDGIHPNDAGYQLIADAVEARIKG